MTPHGSIVVLDAGGDAKIPHADLGLRELLLGRTDLQNSRRRPPRPSLAGALWGLRESESGSERVHHASWTLEAKQGPNCDRAVDRGSQGAGRAGPCRLPCSLASALCSGTYRPGS